MNETNEPNINKFWEQLSNAKLVRYVLLFALGWAIVQVLAYFEQVLVIFIFAAIIAFLLNYPVKWIERFLPHAIAVIIVFLLSLLILAGLIATLGFSILSQAQQLVDQAPQFIEVVISQLEQLQNLLSKWNFQVDFNAFEEEIRNQALAMIGTGFTTVQVLLTNFVDLIIIAVVAFFMLLDGKRIWKLILKIFPVHSREKITVAIQRNFLGFFWGRLLLSIFFGVSTFIIFIILQLPYALILAAIAGVFDLIPGIGATIGITLVCLIILPQGIWLSLQVLVGCILLQQVEENLLMPRIMQGSINMNPVFMFFALLVGARVAGLVGVFLSIPIAGVLISLFDVEEIQGQH
ncbi:AI-2E family transporter [Chlorogloeopsis sp. ULAP01]|uniref:AI-2E family transporter n=1 Tax=Chlorogloeopsis sp. ULAP01 TaxID=3056483 RepID=UPI0025AB1185|nr:AI-2E family transporter [Chlorogloeopsis sp. ULAP01]MDM9379767.1 AI-2E family transporter [Chlorogloeopsis sp. ULAP01]